MTRPFVGCKDMWRKPFISTDPLFRVGTVPAGVHFIKHCVRGTVFCIELQYSCKLPDRLTSMQEQVFVTILGELIDYCLFGGECSHLGTTIPVITGPLLFHPDYNFGQNFAHLCGHLLQEVGERHQNFHGLEVNYPLVDWTMAYNDEPENSHGCILLLSIDPGHQHYVELGNRMGVIADAMLATLWGDALAIGNTAQWWKLAIENPQLNYVTLRALLYTPEQEWGKIINLE